jgi:hypothetical protein
MNKRSLHGNGGEEGRVSALVPRVRGPSKGGRAICKKRWSGAILGNRICLKNVRFGTALKSTLG